MPPSPHLSEAESFQHNLIHYSLQARPVGQWHVSAACKTRIPLYCGTVSGLVTLRNSFQQVLPQVVPKSGPGTRGAHDVHFHQAMASAQHLGTRTPQHISASAPNFTNNPVIKLQNRATQSPSTSPGLGSHPRSLTTAPQIRDKLLLIAASLPSVMAERLTEITATGDTRVLAASREFGRSRASEARVVLPDL